MTNQQPFVKFVRLFYRQIFALYGVSDERMIYQILEGHCHPPLPLLTRELSKPAGFNQ